MSTAGRTAHVIPAVRYRDVDAAILWLKKALGFTEHAVYRNEGGVIIHAELLLGSGMVMLGSVGENREAADWYKQPAEIGNAVTASTYLVVPDCAPVYASAKAAGAEILMELKAMDYGGGSFTVRDPEGQIWSVGEYDPWAAHTA
ncbi:hypothetical protein Terro_4167 [Terriglobus roseus DSM 18391]|uniref:VOC domain-containing protein n=1 Tax=Terriglobus roseus (strain DSM 18391 / NRRL B-41598 / KBS 63) TaxID=926566 RepID=I3ZMA4_TERRK|nr:VOC family protein [Terriglobus roseus]AFL90372.1 hypothetical protein Terro_4167 [Terriglobus roseus DSM 18391]